MTSLRWFAVLFLITVCTSALAQEPPNVVHITKASVASVQKDGQISLVEESVSLPHEWNKIKREGLWRYTIDLPPEALRDPFTSLYIPRIGNRFEIKFNGNSLLQMGKLDAANEDYSRRPISIFLPKALQKPNENTLEIFIYGDMARYAGLSSMDVGDSRTLVESRYAIRDFFQYTLVYAVISLAALFGLLSLAIGVTTRRTPFNLFAITCLFGVIRLSYFVVSQPPISLSWWTWLTEVSYLSFITNLCIFSFYYLEIFSKKILIGVLLAFTTGFFLIPFYAFLRLQEFRQWFNMLLLVQSIVLCSIILTVWYKKRNFTNSILAASATIAILFGAYDHLLVFYSAEGYSNFTISRFTLIFFLFSLGYVVVLDYATRAQRERALRKTLANDLAQKTVELESQFARERAHLQIQTTQQERARIVQDLHDGMGLQLSGILGMVERGKLAREELMFEVRTAIDQMRILVDNTETFDGDWSMLLGTIRHRIESRLKRYDISLIWDMPLSDLPSSSVTQQQAISVQRLFFELATNVIKHSKAKSVTISIGLKSTMLHVRFADDGIGFDVEKRRKGLGSASIQNRIKEMRIDLTVCSSDGAGTAYEMKIPLVAHP